MVIVDLGPFITLSAGSDDTCECQAAGTFKLKPVDGAQSRWRVTGEASQRAHLSAN